MDSSLRGTSVPKRMVVHQTGATSAQTIRTWANQDRVDTGERPGLTSHEREELAQLRREVKQLREEKEILRKATVFFVRETSR